MDSGFQKGSYLQMIYTPNNHNTFISTTKAKSHKTGLGQL